MLTPVTATAEALLPALAAALDGGPAVLPVPPDAARVLAALRPDEPLEPDIALVVPTSGSTGEPKGALLSAAALRASAQATATRL
ncbi:MAG: menE, partial [Frankiales bacterium]|nr:menE [Frankiales bacterium]